MIISLVEYAKRHNKDLDAVRKMALRGSFDTARKLGRDWVIDGDEPYPDRRIKSGKYIGWREKYKKNTPQE